MKTYKIVFKLNQRWCTSLLKYGSEEEKQEKLNRWKHEHVNAYDQLQVIWFDEDYQYDEILTNKRLKTNQD